MSCVETYVPKTWRAPAHQNSYSFRQMTDDARTSEFWIKMHTTKTATAVSNSYNFSLASVSFPKGRSAASVSVKVVYEFACCLFVGDLHCSQSPLFLLAAVCGFFAIFLARHTVDVHTTVSLQEMMDDIRTVQFFGAHHKVQGCLPGLQQGKHLHLSH
jgi:hypothetical protein